MAINVIAAMEQLETDLAESMQDAGIRSTAEAFGAIAQARAINLGNLVGAYKTAGITPAGGRFSYPKF